MAFSLILGGLACPSAHAQWLTKPSSDDLDAAYPAAARASAVTGFAELSCSVELDGKLTACKISAEAPTGHDFGVAGLSLVPLFQMDSATPMGLAARGKRIRIPIRFGGTAEAPPLRAAHYKTNSPYSAYAPAGPYWPDRALRMRAGGFVAVNCFVADDLRLKDCRVATSTGDEFGFADAVLKMAQQGWMTAAPLPNDVLPTPAGVYRFEVTFAARGLRLR